MDIDGPSTPTHHHPVPTTAATSAILQVGSGTQTPVSSGILDVDEAQRPITAPSFSPSVHRQQNPPFPDDRTGKEKSQTAIADKVVLDYLRKRGYKRAEEALMKHDLSSAGVSPTVVDNLDLAVDEAEVDDDLRNMILMLNKPSDLAEDDVRRFEHSYCELRDWVDGSLDIYKAELHSVLYPCLVHCFLEIVQREHWKEARAFLERYSAEFNEDAGAMGETGRREEIMSLMGIASPQHLLENSTAKLFRDNRYELHLSSYAFELIISFLAEDPRRSVLLRILNQRCRVRFDAAVEVTTARHTQPNEQKSTDGKEGGFVYAAEKSGLLRHDILWGRLRPEHYMIPDEGEPVAKKKGKPGDKGKDGKKEGDKKGEEEEEPYTREDGTISESKVPLKKYRHGAPGLMTTADLKNRASLNVLADDAAEMKLPSVLCYTFLNTRGDGLNCSSISKDGSQVVAGFGDSSIRIWDAKAAGTSGTGAGLGGRSSRLVGHSGPVYSVDWTNCARFVLSGSEDGTVRLWNASYKTDLVAYRGHNYPVWSVGFAPMGHYFASGSHDRTGRVWCTDRIHPLRILAGHLADVDVVRWHPNCNYVATGSSDRTARLWDLREGNCVRVFGGQKGTVHSLAFSPDGRTLATSGDGRFIDIWDIGMGCRVRRLQGHKGTVWSMDYSAEGDVLASGGADMAVCLWRAAGWCDKVEAGVELANGDGDVKMENGKEEGDADGDDAADKEKKGGELAKAVPARVLDKGSGSTALLRRFETKETPVHTVSFTMRNLLIAAGSFGT